MHQGSVSWLALRHSSAPAAVALPALLCQLNECVPKVENDMTKIPELQAVLSALLAQLLCGDATEYCPLLEKLSVESRQDMARLLSVRYTRELSTRSRLCGVAGVKSWFALRRREPVNKSEQFLMDLSVFARVGSWPVDKDEHEAKRAAFARKPAQAMEMKKLRGRQFQIAKDRKEHQQNKSWTPSDEEAYTQTAEEIKEKNAPLLAEKDLKILRIRKYLLFLTKPQVKTLKRFMGTCRWTYNQAVAHFCKTNEFNANRICDLYATKLSKKERVCPDDMGKPPEWAFDTPKSLRFNMMRVFQANVASARSNKLNGNIDKYRIKFSSKKQTPFFTISEDGINGSIERKTSGVYLSITKLKGIRVKMGPNVTITSEIKIMNQNGFWYVTIPEIVEPTPYQYQSTCVAFNPGVKAFLTGADRAGNVAEIGRDTKTHLDKLWKRRDDAQQVMSSFKDRPGTRQDQALACTGLT